MESTLIGEARTFLAWQLVRRNSARGAPIQSKNMLLRETILYLPAQLAGPLAQFLSVILRTYFLAPEEMGAFALIAAAREADEAMQRVDHDLYCIDIRSLGFDLYILLLTVISPKAGRNAR